MKLRYFFALGSGICVWAGDDRAREKYGYAIELEQLPLSVNTVSIGNELIKRYDTSIDWENPSGSSQWTEKENTVFVEDCSIFYKLLVQELEPKYVVENGLVEQ